MAYLTSKPNEVVLSTIFSMMVKDFSDLRFDPVTFSTTAAVSSWINQKDLNEEYIDSILIELRNRPNNVYAIEA